MSEYMCSVCNYKSHQRESVIRHFNRKKSCGSGTKEIIEIRDSIKCDNCSKTFVSRKTLIRHMNYYCTEHNVAKKIEELETKIKDLEREKDANTNNIESSMNIGNNNISNSHNTVNNNTVNNISHTVNNITVNNVIVLNNYEDTDLSKLTDKVMYSLIKNSEANQLIIKLFEKLHFNKDIPENHNIYISNIRNKYIKVFRNGRWELMNRETEIDNIIVDKENNVSDWVDANGEKFPEATEKFSEYLEQKGPEQIKIVKSDLELSMYNNRHMIQKN
jgi:hypothetical protein